MKETGVDTLGGEKGYTTLEKLWIRPTCEVNGMLSGYTGEGAKTVLPSKAMAKVSCRLVPDQDPAAIEALMKAHVARVAPPGVTVTVTHLHGGPPWRAQLTRPFLHAARRAPAAAVGQGPAIFRLEDHLQRMVNSCKIYRMDVPYGVDELVAACCELVERNGLQSCYIRPMVLRGYGAAGMVPFDSPVEVYLPCWPWGTYLGEGALENGVDACVSTWNRVAPNTIPAMAKMAGNYLGSQLIKMEALRNGFAEAIALSTDGTVSEGSGQNVFVVYRGTLHTPTINGTLLHGITRHSILALARDMGIPVREQEVPREM